jgi:transposase
MVPSQSCPPARPACRRPPISVEGVTATTMAHLAPPRVTIGVDTHLEVHVAHAKDQLGRRLAAVSIPTTPAGYRRLLAWAGGLGEVEAFGVEGTGSYGAGLARFLRDHGQVVVEVNRPDRQARRRRGKSDPLDAEAAARTVQAGEATVVPKASDGVVEMLRCLRVARESAVKARTQAGNAIRALLVTAPAELREQLRGLPTAKLVRTAAAFPVGKPATPTAATMLALRLLAVRHQALAAEISALDGQLERLTAKAAPRLRARFGVGAESAAALLVAAGDNPDRLHSEAAFAMLCGSAPVEASSGKTVRHRLNRGGDRQANAALHRVVIVRLRWHQPTRDYMTRRLAEAKTKREIIRCLKRYVAREVFAALKQLNQDLTEAA